MVVLESAVCTELMVASSAWTAEAMLTAPRAARPSVHLLNFILFLRCCLFVVVYCVRRGKNSLPQHLDGAFEVKSRKMGDKCNHFFGGGLCPIMDCLKNETVGQIE